MGVSGLRELVGRHATERGLPFYSIVRGQKPEGLCAGGHLMVPHLTHPEDECTGCMEDACFRNIRSYTRTSLCLHVLRCSNSDVPNAPVRAEARDTVDTLGSPR